MIKVREIYSSGEIRSRAAELAAKISADYRDLDCPVVIGVLKGSFRFLADLVANMQLPKSMQIEFVHLASYGAANENTGTVQAPYLNLPNIKNRHILIVEDIIDSGRTASFLIDYLNNQFTPASIKLAVLLDKKTHRIVPIEADYVGFEIGDTFIVGYGFDHDGLYRELPYLGELVTEQTKR